MGNIEVYEPANISDGKAREIEESARRIINENDSQEVILHEVTFLRHDVARLRRRVDFILALLVIVGITLVVGITTM
jgi:predicted RNA methylase